MSRLFCALLVVLPAWGQLPDLVVERVGTALVTTDSQTLATSGQVTSTIKNVGSSVASGSTRLLAFEDRNKNARFDAGTDVLLGSLDISMILQPGASSEYSISVSGTVLFRGNRIWVAVDVNNTIAESSDDNNLGNSGQNSQFTPPTGPFAPTLKWSWTGSARQPSATNVCASPLVIDLNKDGIPEIVFVSTATTGANTPSFLRAVNGQTGAEIFTIDQTSPTDLRVHSVASPAAGDIDGDGFPEIIAMNRDGTRLLAFEHDGTFRWQSDPIGSAESGAPLIADLNGDGVPEIVYGRRVLRSTGELMWTGQFGAGINGLAESSLAVAADVDLDGQLEVIAGNTVYSSTGIVKYRNQSIADGYTAVANFDSDATAEIVLVAAGKVYLLEHDLRVKWGPVNLPGGGNGGPPTIADFDGDGLPEIGVAGGTRYVVFESDGTLKWQATTRDGSSSSTGSTVFDFEGDGSAEVIYRDELRLRVYRGWDGLVLFDVPMSSGTSTEAPVIADVDRDGRADIVAIADNRNGYGPQRGLFVYSSQLWVPTRAIWNQHAYSITNVNDDGTIPAVPTPNWLVQGLNSFRLNTFATPLEATAVPDVTTSFVRVTEITEASARLTARIGNGGAAQRLGPNLIRNGDFEACHPSCAGVVGISPGVSSTLLGWTIVNQQIELVCGIGQTASNDCWVDLYGTPGVGGIEQTITTTPGARYVLRFFLAGNPAGAPSIKTIRVTAGGIVKDFSFDITNTSLQSMGWVQHTLEFFATDSQTAIRIQALDSPSAQKNWGPAIDLVEVFQARSSTVAVSFYLGDQAAGGTLIGTTQTSRALGSGEFEDVSMVWTNPPAGAHFVTVVADPDNLMPEGDETNNKAGALLLLSRSATPLVDSLVTRFKDSSVDLSWTRVTGAATYNVYRRNGGGSVQQIRSGITSASFSDSGLVNGTLYYYTVRWVTSTGVESPDGTEASSTPTPIGSTGQTPPTILSTPSTRGVAGQPYSYQLRAADPDMGEVLTYSLTNPPSGMTISHAGLIQWTPSGPQAGYNRINVRVQDRTGRIATQSYQLFIDAVFTNSPPVFTSTPITSAQTGQLYAYTARASDPDTGDLVSYSLTAAPPGMTINGAGLIQWTPQISQVGSHTVTVRVADLGGLSAAQTFQIAVTRLNRPPQITSSAPATGRVGTTYAYQVTATDPDLASGDSLTFSLVAGPAGMTMSTAGLLQWTPSQAGSQQAAIRVTDTGGLSATQSFQISVLAANQPPAITSLPVTRATVAGNYTYQAAATDPENDVLTWSVAQGPAGLTIVSTTGLVRWTPAPAQLGEHPVVVRVTDNLSSPVTQAFTIRVEPQDTTLPTVSILTPASGATVTLDQNVIGSVDDANLLEWTVSYRALGDSTWTQFGRGTSNVSAANLGTLPATLLANNVYRVLLTARDIAGNNRSQEIEISVNSGQLKLGDFTVDFEDLRVPGFTFPISMTRKYDSKRTGAGDFGPGWTLSFSEVDVRRDANYNVFLTLPDGRRVKFRYTPTSAGVGVFNTAFTSDSGVYDTLENLDCPQVFGNPPGPLCNGFTVWEPQNWRLRTKEGVTYEISGSSIRRISDRNGNWIEISSTGVTSNTGRNVTIARDLIGQVTRITSPTGGQLRYEYDSVGRLSRFVDENGKATTFYYEDPVRSHYLSRIVDALGRLVLKNVFNAEGRLIAQCDADDDATTLAGCRQFTYAPGTRTFNAVNGRGFRSELTLDARGNVLRERRYKDATAFEDTVRTYDASDNLLTEVDPGGGSRSYSYDLRGNRLTETDPGGRITRYSWHSTCDKVLTTTDPAGKVTTNAYDTRCNLTSVADAIGGTTAYEYNFAGQRTRMIDPEGTTWTWAYLANGLLEKVTDPFGKATTFTFDNRGQVLSRVDRNGKRIDFQYDAAGRLTKETWNNGKITDYSYDDTGALLNANDGENRLAMTYDSLGRLRTVSNVNSGSAPPSTLTYDYDANGNVNGIAESPAKRPFSGSWTVQYAYDFRDRLSRVTSKMQDHTFTYSASGLRTQTTAVARYYQNDGSPIDAGPRVDVPAIRTLYEYDCPSCADRLSAIRYRRSSDDSVLHDFTFQRDVVGNITSMTDRLGTHTFSYDPVRRLTAAIHPTPATQPAEQYAYDDAGNRETSHLSASHSIQKNRLLEDARSTYVYDDEGNLISKADKVGGERTAYTYDHRNRLTAVVVRNASNAIVRQADYSYDAFNRRTRINEGRGNIFYFYDGMNPILRTWAVPGPMLSYRLYTRTVDDILGEDIFFNAAGFGSRFFIKDQVGTVRDSYEHYGSSFGRFYFANRYTYDSFGQVLRREPTTMFEDGRWGAEYPNDVLFTAREFSQVSGDGYFRSRHYKALLGRFGQEDWQEPYGYSYVSGNPLNLIDPQGESEEAPLLSALVQTASTALREVGRCAVIVGVTTTLAVTTPQSSSELKALATAVRKFVESDQVRRRGVCKLSSRITGVIGPR